jgi:hypothetical protein
MSQVSPIASLEEATGVVVPAGANNNQTVTLHTATQDGLALIVNITTATTATLLVTISGVSASGYVWPILTSTSLTAVGVTVLRIGPSLVAAANLTVNDLLPAQLRIAVTVTGTIVYGIDYDVSGF